MANCRPAGLSDEDSDSDDNYGFFDKQNRNQFYATNIKKTETKLQDAVISGDLVGICKIIAEDLRDDVNAKLESGWTPLSHACFHAQENIVKYLLEKGADPNVQADSVSPVMLACSNNSANESVIYNIVSSLIEKNCVLNVGDKYGVTPLMRAVINGRLSVVELIMDKKVNIEMRDRQGWTAVFWAVHHNQHQCLEMLLSKNARLNIVDKSNRSPLEIANSHENDETIRILQQYAPTTNVDDNMGICPHTGHFTDAPNWQDYYPGLRDDNKPTYTNEITHLLYGINCDRFCKNFENMPIDLRTFLLLENEDMIKLGIEMRFERQRLRCGLRSFHTRNWRVSAVAGLETYRNESYSIIDCLNILATHLLQSYIMEATLTYVLRDYRRNENQIEFVPPDSPKMDRLFKTSKKMISTINNLKREIDAMKKVHTKLSEDSLKPVDLITERRSNYVALEVFTQIAILGSLSYVVFRALSSILKN